MNIVNYESGDVVIQEDEHEARLHRDLSNRLILMARMHTVAEFIDLLPSFITDELLLNSIRQKFSHAENSSERWNLKEKFARLTTLTKGYVSPNPEAILEKVVF